MIPLSLYVHIPWCEKKCPYCDFNSHLARTEVDQSHYIDTLLNDFSQDVATFKEDIADRNIESIFIGGGTPSLFDAASYDYLLSELKKIIPFNDDIEITLEANPGSSEVEKFSGFRKAGINRLSIGIQSFNAQHLFALGRIHNSKDAINAAEFARQAGFDNFNLDIMFGLPEQSIEQSVDDVRQAIELKPTHLSCYQLTIEPNTLFHHRPPITPDDDTLWDMQSLLQQTLLEHGYIQYEVSAYAKQGKQCRHNINYWQYGDYLGIGAGAHGKITKTNGDISRYWKIKHPNTYIDNDKKVGELKTISKEERVFEFMMNCLRLNKGFTLELFEQATNLKFNIISSQIEQHINRGLLISDNGQIKTTSRGKQMLNNILEEHLP